MKKIKIFGQIKSGDSMFKIWKKYDILIAKEKQAARSGICFSAISNEKAFDEVKQGVRKHELSST